MPNNFQDKANFIWKVADDVLRGTFKAHEYGDVILPFVVLRRLDAVLEAKKDDVIKQYRAVQGDAGRRANHPGLTSGCGRNQFLQPFLL